MGGWGPLRVSYIGASFPDPGQWGAGAGTQASQGCGTRAGGGTGGDVSCHLQSSGLLLGGRGPALGGLTLPSLESSAAVACPKGPPPPGSSLDGRAGELMVDGPQAKLGELCPSSGGRGFGGFSLGPLSQADPGGPGPCRRAAVTPAHPREGGCHVSCLAHTPLSACNWQGHKEGFVAPGEGRRMGGLAPFIS